MSIIRWITDRIPPYAAVLLNGVITAVAVSASLFTTSFGTQTSIAIVVLSFFAPVIATYVLQYTPYIRLKNDTKSDLVSFALEDLLRKYDSQVADADCELRANVMIAEKRFSTGLLPTRESYLTMKYDAGNYPDAEREQEYVVGEGCAGTCFAENDPTYYPSDCGAQIEESLSATKREITEEIDSILSVPIYSNNNTEREPIGVLNIDSPQPLSDTGFDKEVAQTLAMRHASVVGDIIS